MTGNAGLVQIQQMGIGLAFILFPLVFVFAFAVHRGLLKPRLLAPGELITRAHGDKRLQFGHVLVLFNTGLLVVAALYLMKILGDSSFAWAGFIGGASAVLGAILLAADKGALCLTMSALDTLPETEFARMQPGVLAMFTKKGWLVVLWGMLLLPIGFAIQAIALLKTGIIPHWQSALFLIGVLLVGTPDGLEIINLSASILMTIAFVPYGIEMIAKAF